uniref:Phospholipid-transporting ATPase n=1 Tax=Macrostomum lignano TaxID=282301 RepID=A0A1I8J6G5_9PLAT
MEKINRKKPSCFQRCWRRCCHLLRHRRPLLPRLVRLGQPMVSAPNLLRNQKYSALSFIPQVLYEQFSVFLNFCFLVMALSQFVTALKIGYLYTYWGPLSFVICVTALREAVDDLRRWRRDRELNSALYEVAADASAESAVRLLPSRLLQVGHVVRLAKGDRVPADLVLLRAPDRRGACYLRTDQLDGETDWKLRVAPAATQLAWEDSDLNASQGSTVWAERPSMDLSTFVGTLTTSTGAQVPLGIENTLWAGTVLASAGPVLGVVVYTGRETRAAMNSAKPRSKLSLIDSEVNLATKVLVVSVLLVSLLLVGLKGFGGQWYKYFWRFLLLFSYIIPLALRMNLDMAKIIYAFMIVRDKCLDGCVVRNTTVPEELGRISYLLSDKTGTLTENNMVFKKLHLGSLVITDDADSLAEVRCHVTAWLKARIGSDEDSDSERQTQRDGGGARAAEAVRALALCHNVTPVPGEAGGPADYQASSPDEVALVGWAACAGLALAERDQDRMVLLAGPADAAGVRLEYRLLQVFPFSSESKRMGVLVRDEQSGEIAYYTKGADSVLAPLVQPLDWIDEEVANLSREGLRTLLVARRCLTPEFYRDWSARYEQAGLAVRDREQRLEQVRQQLDSGLELLCVTGVEDRLADGVRRCLETLRDAGVRVWMLTGDRLETACCIASRPQPLLEIRQFQAALLPLPRRRRRLLLLGFPILRKADPSEIPQKGRRNRRQNRLQTNFYHKFIRNSQALALTGAALEAAVAQDERLFARIACRAPAVVVSRCSPTQKAAVVRLLQPPHWPTLRRYWRRRYAGGYSSQAADCGLGIAGREGRQAALAADVSVSRFEQSARLLLVHGRRCYRNSALLAPVCNPSRPGYLSYAGGVLSGVLLCRRQSVPRRSHGRGYATVFTNFPVFSLVLDRDVPATTAEKFPELYRANCS